MKPSREKCSEGFDPSLLVEYVEGGLEPSVLSELEEHLPRCPFCSSELGLMKRMDSLLRSYPEAFHPSEDELYGFVTLDKDTERRIAVHLESCAECRAEAELLRRLILEERTASQAEPTLPAYLARELDRLHPSLRPRERTWAEFWSSLGEWISAPFRGRPMLSLGTVAALLLIAVLVTPLWREFKEIPDLSPRAPVTTGVPSAPAGVGSKADAGRPAQDEVKQVSRPSAELPAPPAEAVKAKETYHKPAAGPAKSSDAQGLPSADHAAGGTVVRELTDGLADRSSGEPKSELPASPEALRYPRKRAVRHYKGEIAKAPSAPQAEEATPTGDLRESKSQERALDKDQSGREQPGAPSRGPERRFSAGDKENEVPEENLDAAHPLVGAPGAAKKFSAATQDGRTEVSARRIPVTVRIVDRQGKEIAGVRFNPPEELKNRYSFLNGTGPGKRPQEKPAISASGELGFERSKRRDVAGELVILVTAAKYGSLYHLKADLMKEGAAGVLKSIEADGIGKEDLEAGIASLVSWLLR